MPRGTSRPPEVMIGELEAKKSAYQTKIDSYKTKISQIDSKISSLHSNARQKEVERILDAVKQSGKSVDDFITSFLETARLGGTGS